MKKKIICTVLGVISAIALSACGNNNGDNAEVSGGDAASEANENTTEDEFVIHTMDISEYVTLGDYKGVEVTVSRLPVDEAEVDTMVKQAYGAYATIEDGGIVDRAIEMGDLVNFDYLGKINGEAFEGGTAEGATLEIGSGQFIPGFEEKMIGLMPGETADLELKFPDDYWNPDYAGAESVFTVTIHFILPEEIPDEVVARMGIEGVNNYEELWQYAYTVLDQSTNSNYDSYVREAVVSACVENCVFGEIPQSLIDEYRRLAEDELNNYASNYNTTPEDFAVNYIGITYEDYVEKNSLDTLKADLMYQAIANIEGLDYDDDELNDTLLGYATIAGFETVDEYVKSYFGENMTLENMRTLLMADRVIAFLVENAVVNN